MDETFRGGCFCGAVRFEIGEIFDKLGKVIKAVA